MNRQPPRKVRIIYDSREQYPLIFPAYFEWWSDPRYSPRLVQVEAKKAKLEAGDYAIHTHERAAIVERKGSLGEIATNLFTADKTRQAKAFDKLQKATDNPYLLVEVASLRKLFEYDGVKSGCQPDARCVLDALVKECVERGIRLMMVTGGKDEVHRRLLGEVVLRLLMGHVFREKIIFPATPSMPTTSDGKETTPSDDQ